MTRALSIFALVASLCGCADKASFHREYQQRIANAATADERRRNELEYQLLCVAEKGSLSSRFNTADGVSEFEAWMLVKVYAFDEIGSCLDLGLPQRRDHSWVVPTFVGRAGNPGPPVIVESTSGKITCEGHPTVNRPQEYLAKHDAKFKSLSE